MYEPGDGWRASPIPPKANLKDEPYRSEWRRDYARIMHAPSFRRLVGKTQLFPGDESDFFRNRLTHSLEVAQLAKDIAIKINSTSGFSDPQWNVSPDICECAGLMHDMGHPPFGHNGERALDDCMKDSGGFEGNAQTIRIITKLEKKERMVEERGGERGFVVIDEGGEDKRIGLNLTARVIASALKYDTKIEYQRKKADALVKGYYASEEKLVKSIKEQIVGPRYKGIKGFKTIECQIMDIADDISYSTYDLEDAFKVGFLNPYDLISADSNILEQIADKLKGVYDIDQIKNAIVEVFGNVFRLIIDTRQKAISPDDPKFFEKSLTNYIDSYEAARSMSSDGYRRTQFTSTLVNMFMDGITVEFDKGFPALSKVDLVNNVKLQVNVLKHFAYVALINSSRLKIVEFRGYDIVKSIFDALSNYDKEGYRLLPEDFQKLYHDVAEADKNRVICDFIAGMTDRYALEFYCRLFSENPQTIFKPF